MHTLLPIVLLEPPPLRNLSHLSRAHLLVPSRVTPTRRLFASHHLSLGMYVSCRLQFLNPGKGFPTFSSFLRQVLMKCPVSSEFTGQGYFMLLGGTGDCVPPLISEIMDPIDKPLSFSLENGIWHEFRSCDWFVGVVQYVVRRLRVGSFSTLHVPGDQ